MKHKYDNISVPDGASYIDQTCINCGALRRKYATGSKSYYKNDGRVTTYSSLCSASYGDNLNYSNDKLRSRLDEAMIMVNLAYEELNESKIKDIIKRYLKK